MGRKIEAMREQQYLLPPSIDDWIASDHPARFVSDFVESLDLAELGFREPESEIGRPYYGAELLLGAWLYGYFHGVRSCRAIEAMCRNDIGMMWLTGRRMPDHNTLWRFFAGNRMGLEEVFTKCVALARAMHLIGMAVNARRRDRK